MLLRLDLVMQTLTGEIFPSEILWRSWVKAPKTYGQISQLQVIAQYFIVNAASKEVIRDAWAYSTYTRDEHLCCKLTPQDPGWFLRGAGEYQWSLYHENVEGPPSLGRRLQVDGTSPSAEEAARKMTLRAEKPQHS